VKLWQVQDGSCRHTLQGHQSWVTAVAFAPDGSLLASASGDDTIRFWDVETGKCLQVLDNRPYAGLNIAGAVGLTEGQRDSLLALGAVQT
jgi:WD40 repeat protein